MQNRKELNLAVVPLAPQKSCCGSALELEMKLLVFRRTRWLCNLKAKRLHSPDTDDAEQFMWQDCPGALELETLPLKQCWQENKKKKSSKQRGVNRRKKLVQKEADEAHIVQSCTNEHTTPAACCAGAHGACAKHHHHRFLSLSLLPSYEGGKFGEKKKKKSVHQVKLRHKPGR